MVYVVFDPYWDELGMFLTEQEAKQACEQRWRGAHYLWRPDGVQPTTNKIWDEDGCPPTPTDEPPAPK
jgi:hypothetical protein